MKPCIRVAVRRSALTGDVMSSEEGSVRGGVTTTVVLGDDRPVSGDDDGGCLVQIFGEGGWWEQGRYSLIALGLATTVLQVWMIIGGCLLVSRVKGIPPEPADPIPVG